MTAEPNEASDVQSDLRTRVQIKAWKDADFRQLLKDDPRAAIESLGETVPEGLQFEVVKDLPGKFHLVIADPPSGDPSTVEERELAYGRGGNASEGRSCTLTAECFCPRTLTGACGLFC